MSTRTLVTSHEIVDRPDDEVILSAFHTCTQTGFWLDVVEPDDSDYLFLEHALGFHPLTIDDIRHRNQRPKFEDYGGYSFVVIFGARYGRGELTFIEHHVYVAPHYCVSVRHERDPIIEQLLDRRRKNGEVGSDLSTPPSFSYLVMDHVVDGMFGVLDTLDNQVDDLLDAIIETSAEGKLVEITKLNHHISELRRVLGAQQDLFQRLLSHVVFAGREDVSHYYRDVYDHVIRQYDMIDSLRDLLSSAMDVYLSSVSNRLNSTVKALTVIACLFLPLTFLTGFFGMNFGALVSMIGAPWTLGVGIGVMLLSVVLQLALFRQRGWI